MQDTNKEKILHGLREIGIKHAEAKKQLTTLEHGRQILLADLMKEYLLQGEKTVAGQDREARADDRYKKHIEALGIAIENELKWAWEKKIVEINFEKWKTEMINNTIERKNYG
ncbi:MAG: hypothetical protein Tp1100DCM1099271_21 [Prokaryotic dsDNA virus sp.]|jgi:hypothetical protein|nr:MAG: hypothetical protein Tp1102SUR405181_5 [Prokaryotic dsDNA virus sp.]QDP60049.1 MAG: hypothetical protein Tp1100DCM1099271_21 [Prokaryotic dsDNA virus sp.]QDP67117.1 MAG: hypothetical protein Tp1111SUR49671_37 [Prokaryotic dsDNA virus sp.]|tara:strand:+ start:9897 stop:10235 length:339 start_codon:yes stop_codon:yes gene_type:complete